MSFVRRLAEHAPVISGAVRALSYIPFKWRKSADFGRRVAPTESFERLSPEDRRQWVFEKTRKLVVHAERSVPFYKALYAERGFSSSELKVFDDLQRIPIVTKADFKSCGIEERCDLSIAAADSNTGGTSGQPLSFRVEKALNDKEWAYIYHMWQRREWRPGALKLRFGGANLGERPCQYVPTEGEFLINTYLSQDVTCRAIAELLKNHPIHYLHGYPSAVAAFARHAGENFGKEIVQPIRQSLRGILLGSEFPAPLYRDIIEETFGQQALSWYGHSEKAVLAGEMDRAFVYHPFQSYGWTEAVVHSEGPSHRLVGTNLDGFACPFIRYDTGDTIEPLAFHDGLLDRFRIAEGRVGDIVFDAKGNEISLTALIFGRHHGIFEEASHLQVAQETPGEVLLLVSGVPSQPERERRFWDGFDTTGVSLQFSVRFLEAPIRTGGGKVALKVPYPED